jgi:ferric-dicitrate binding protein FerR (iron transport regulator)
MGEAVRILQPLCDERDRLVAAIASDNAEHQAALANAESVLQSVTQAALEAVQADPKVLAARRALERFNDGPGAADVPLTRGRVRLKADENILPMLEPE